MNKPSQWITPQDWEEGKYNLPPMKISTQNYLRSKKKQAIKYTKNGRSVLYRIDWILEYLEMNTVQPKVN